MSVLKTLRRQNFTNTIKHCMGLFKTMPQAIGSHLINDDYDAELGFVLGFDTKESADHAEQVLKGPSLFWPNQYYVFDRKLFTKEETGLDFDHYAIYVKLID